MIATQCEYDDKVIVSWSRSIAAESYDIWRDSGIIAFSLPRSSNSFSDTNINSGQIYNYKVKAVNSFGESVLSSSANGWTQVLSSPENLMASDGITGTILVEWDAQTNADEYELWRGVNDNLDNANFFDSIIDNSILLNINSNFTGLLYYFWIRSKNSLCTSNFSNFITGWAYGAPQPPQNIQASDSSFTDRIEITWDASLGADGYEIYRSDTDDPDTSVMVGQVEGNLVFNDFTAVPTFIYYYWIKSFNMDFGASSISSNIEDGRRKGNPGPVEFNVSDGDIGPVLSSWNEIDGVSSYEVWRSVNNEFGNAVKIAENVITTQFLDDTAKTSTLYFYWVRGIAIDIPTEFSSRKQWLAGRSSTTT